VTLTFLPVADTYVEPSTTHPLGATTRLEVDHDPIRQAFLRFAVTGVAGRTVTDARLRLRAGTASDSASASGGTIHLISSNSWSEGATNYGNRPAIDGPGLDSVGPVAVDQVVEFRLTGALTGDGVYNFALDTLSGDAVRYRSRESSTGKPQLILTVR
jgi:hypothetical protein